MIEVPQNDMYPALNESGHQDYVQDAEVLIGMLCWAWLLWKSRAARFIVGGIFLFWGTMALFAGTEWFSMTGFIPALILLWWGFKGASH